LPGAQSSGVQPGTSPNLLTSQGDIPLGNQQLTTVSLNTGSAPSTEPPAPAPAKHHLNAELIIVVVVLVLVAAALAVGINRSAKNTTY